MWEPNELWQFLPYGYLLTIGLETPVLIVGLSRQHSWRRRLFAGVGLTLFTYPIVVLVLPLLLGHFADWVYITVAETFAPMGECLLFYLAFGGDLRQRSTQQDFLAIILANITSFLVGEWLFSAW